MQLPLALIASLDNAPGFDAGAFVAVHAAEEKITSIRFNPAKLLSLPAKPYADSLQPVPWSAAGYYLPTRPSFTFDPLFHGGLYYVQEASSMFLEQALTQSADLQAPLRVLDLCAAPGGKSTLIQSLLSPGSLLVSNDVIKSRAAILEENMIKWGGANVIVTNNDPRDFQKLPAFFDVIVIDAPCSGSGLFRRDPYLVKEWSLQNVELCCQRQQRILADVLPALKEGGVLIYATCSYSVEEDENIADWLMDSMGMESIPLQLPEGSGIVQSISEKGRHAYRFYPYQVRGEGLFITVLRMPAGRGKQAAYRAPSPAAARLDAITAQEARLVQPWLKEEAGFRYVKFKSVILALPDSWKEDALEVMALMYVKKAGIKLGELMNGGLVPDHQLALSGMVSEQVPFIELSEEDAIVYLKKETLQTDTPLRGWVLVKCKGLALGWIKVLPNRINNYYPKEWRILRKDR